MTSISRMPEQNQVVLAGRLTHDPDLRYTQKGQALCRLDIAVNRRYKDPSSGDCGQKRRQMQVTARRIQFLAATASSGQDVPPSEPPAQDVPDTNPVETEEEVPF